MAFTCTLANGYRLESCSLSQGGVTCIYLAPWSALTYTLATDDAINAVNLSGSSFYKFDCITETAEFTQKSTSNIQNQSLYFEQEVSLIIPKQDAAKRNQYKSLAGSGVLAIVQDRQGILSLIGKTQAAFLVEGSVSAGKSASDFNGYTLKFQAKEPEPAHIVTGTTSFTFTY